MNETTQLVVSNLLDGFRQLNSYLTAGLVASISALVLDRAYADAGENTPVSVMGFVPMSAKTAKLVLLGVVLVAGFMGSFTAEGVGRIVTMLRGSDVLTAACTFSSIATAPMGSRALAASLPVIFVGVILLRKDFREPGAYALLFLFCGVYGVIGWMLVSRGCPAP